MISHKGHKEKAVFEVCDLGKSAVILGHPWLRKHNPEINWQTGEVKMSRCPRECNVWIRAATKERKRRKLAEKWKYKATVEEVEDEEEFVRRGGTMVENDGILEEIVEEVFIRRAEKEEEAMPDLCQDSDDDEDDILNYYVHGRKNHWKKWYPGGSGGG